MSATQVAQLPNVGERTRERSLVRRHHGDARIKVARVVVRQRFTRGAVDHDPEPGCLVDVLHQFVQVRLFGAPFS